jgi:hypothetical protein
LLNELSVQLAPALTYIYQKSITAGEVPDDWKMAHVVALYGLMFFSIFFNSRYGDNYWIHGIVRTVSLAHILLREDRLELTQKSITAGEVPDDWKMAHVVPIFKKGDKSKSSNYMPVSTTSICSTLMEHILHSNIMSHFMGHLPIVWYLSSCD